MQSPNCSSSMPCSTFAIRLVQLPGVAWSARLNPHLQPVEADHGLCLIERLEPQLTGQLQPSPAPPPPINSLPLPLSTFRGASSSPGSYVTCNHMYPSMNTGFLPFQQVLSAFEVNGQVWQSKALYPLPQNVVVPSLHQGSNSLRR
jgi:hypothetical protein